MGRIKSGLTVLLTLLVVANATPLMLSTAADEGENPFGLLGEPEPSSWFSVTGVTSAVESFTTLGDRLMYDFTPEFVHDRWGDEVNATVESREFRTTANENRNATIAYLNQFAPSTYNKTDYDTIKLIFTSEDGENAVVYINGTTNAETNTFESGVVQTEKPADVDWTIELDRYAQQKVTLDIEWIQSNYIDPEREPDTALNARLTNRYLGHIDYTAGNTEAADV